MDQFLYRLVGSLGTLVTALFLVDFEKNGVWANAFLLFAVLYASGFLAIDAWRAFSNRPLSFDRSSDRGKRKIAEYLVKQLKGSGSVAILSKDLTWVKEGGEAEALLVKKARDGELTLFVEEEMPITTRLKSCGADVRVYAAQKRKGFSPKSRFTVLDYRSGKTRVMIGAPSNGRHLIKHYGEEDFEVVDLARDFIALLECTAKEIK